MEHYLEVYHPLVSFICPLYITIDPFTFLCIHLVQHGLVIPGQDNKIKVRCGSSLGVGIYLSPDPTFSLR